MKIRNTSIKVATIFFGFLFSAMAGVGIFLCVLEWQRGEWLGVVFSMMLFISAVLFFLLVTFFLYLIPFEKNSRTYMDCELNEKGICCTIKKKQVFFIAWEEIVEAEELNPGYKRHRYLYFSKRKLPAEKIEFLRKSPVTAFMVDKTNDFVILPFSEEVLGYIRKYYQAPIPRKSKKFDSPWEDERYIKGGLL